MSIAYAFSGGIARSSGPRGSANVAMRAVTSTTSSGRTMKLMSALVDCSSPKKISFGSRAWMFSCAPYTSRTVRSSRIGNGDDRQADAAPAEQDAEADAEEARHQQEVAEEPDVADVRRDPPDQQQLDEQDRGAGQQESDRSAGERPEWGDRASRIREGSWHVATVAVRCVMSPTAFRSTRRRRMY